MTVGWTPQGKRQDQDRSEAWAAHLKDEGILRAVSGRGMFAVKPGGDD
ncbi:hypothetical protein [Actinomadura madurae]|nr:hypothetical protein [Actinomadura madurae]MCP9949327.1 hypothetical protein [Actinomadura madurae]MCP9966084.1 hypothetical protein [Actinomadura madurae]MCP9978569.1 hypothetical protein [Actinomadura madurae]MCQ0009903.1 hypothetical protein [Actinomadura madurae]MCQ0014771.1 hypothetical protein [Actinomadura madurae]